MAAVADDEDHFVLDPDLAEKLNGYVSKIPCCIFIMFFFMVMGLPLTPLTSSDKKIWNYADNHGDIANNVIRISPIEYEKLSKCESEVPKSTINANSCM